MHARISVLPRPAATRRWLCAVLMIAALPCSVRSAPAQPEGASPDLLAELAKCPHSVLFETRRDGNWELYRMRADGSEPVNLTRTADVDELYPKASPDGSMICFEADEGAGAARARNVYVMNADGTGRRKIADNARDPCWGADRRHVAFLRGEFDAYSLVDYATRGIFIHDLETGGTRAHPNAKIKHLYTLNATAGLRWFVAVVHGGMGFSHNILALEGAGDGVFDLKCGGCRPDVSADDRLIAWGHGDFAIGVAELDLDASPPVTRHARDVVTSRDPVEVYHPDWSPDARHIAFSRGPKRDQKGLRGLLPEFPGVDAPGWDICVADARATNRWVQLTFDGQSNKEPDWQRAVPAGQP